MEKVWTTKRGYRALNEGGNCFHPNLSLSHSLSSECQDAEKQKKVIKCFFFVPRIVSTLEGVSSCNWSALNSLHEGKLITQIKSLSFSPRFSLKKTKKCSVTWSRIANCRTPNILASKYAVVLTAHSQQFSGIVWDRSKRWIYSSILGSSSLTFIHTLRTRPRMATLGLVQKRWDGDSCAVVL